MLNKTTEYEEGFKPDIKTVRSQFNAILLTGLELVTFHEPAFDLTLGPGEEAGYCIRLKDLFVESGDYIFFPHNYYVIGLSEEFESWNQFLETLAHETIHFYQMVELGEEPNHGKSFKKWAKVLNEKMGVNIQVPEVGYEGEAAKGLPKSDSR